MIKDYLTEMFPHELIQMIDAGSDDYKLTDQQVIRIRQLIEDGSVRCYKRRKPKVNHSMLWRLTFPFYFAFVFGSVLSILPIKWIITGHFYYDSDTKFSKIIKKWSSKLGL